MALRNPIVRLSVVSTVSSGREERAAGKRHKASPWTALTHSINPERAELLERLTGPGRTLTGYGHELASIGRKAPVLQVQSPRLLKKVRQLQRRPEPRAAGKGR